MMQIKSKKRLQPKMKKDLYHSQLEIFLDPNDPAVAEEAKAQGIPLEWIEAAQKSPIYK